VIDPAALRRGSLLDQGRRPAATMRAISALEEIIITMSSN